jgi:RNA polymerase sigma factor (sigma-70 family)
VEVTERRDDYSIAYLADALPPLGREEHLLLFKEYRSAVTAGDTERARAAMDLLIRHNIGLAYKFARRYWMAHGQRSELSDIMSGAVQGLRRGIEKFDPDRGYAPSSLLYWWCMQGAGLVAGDDYQIHVPHRDGRAAMERREQRNRLNSMLSLDASVRGADGEDGDSLGEFIASDTVPADEAVARREERRRAHALLAKLPDRERLVLEWRFGVGEDHDLTLEQIAQRLHVSRERVRQIEMRALQLLREITELGGTRGRGPARRARVGADALVAGRLLRK